VLDTADTLTDERGVSTTRRLADPTQICHISVIVRIMRGGRGFTRAAGPLREPFVSLPHRKTTSEDGRIGRQETG
jgi:hypothetical protein